MFGTMVVQIFHFYTGLVLFGPVEKGRYSFGLLCWVLFS